MKLTKELISDTAFKVWGKNYFKDMSLTHISCELGISKAALYRHFASKEALLDYMIENIKYSIADQIDFFIKNHKKEDPVKSYIECLVNFFTTERYRLFFYTIILSKNAIFKDEKMNELHKVQTEIFENYLNELNLDKSLYKAESVLFYTSTAVIFYLSFNFFLNSEFKISDTKPAGDKEKSEYINDLTDIIYNGFLTDSKCEINIDYENIEKISTVKKEMIPKREKLLNAIAQVVAEESLWNVTIDKIAKKLGMAKSSLYLYFSNKNEMIGDMIVNEFLIFIKIFDRILSNFETFNEKFYANIFGTFTHLINDPEHLKILNWFHIQDIKIKNQDKLFYQRYKFIIDSIEEGKIKSVLKLDIFPVIFMNVQISKEIIICNEIGKELGAENTRFIYNMFLKGIKGMTFFKS